MTKPAKKKRSTAGGPKKLAATAPAPRAEQAMVAVQEAFAAQMLAGQREVRPSTWSEIRDMTPEHIVDRLWGTQFLPGYDGLVRRCEYNPSGRLSIRDELEGKLALGRADHVSPIGTLQRARELLHKSSWPKTLAYFVALRPALLDDLCRGDPPDRPYSEATMEGMKGEEQRELESRLPAACRRLGKLVEAVKGYCEQNGIDLGRYLKCEVASISKNIQAAETRVLSSGWQEDLPSLLAWYVDLPPQDRESLPRVELPLEVFEPAEAERLRQEESAGAYDLDWDEAHAEQDLREGIAREVAERERDKAAKKAAGVKRKTEKAIAREKARADKAEQDRTAAEERAKAEKEAADRRERERLAAASGPGTESGPAGRPPTPSDLITSTVVTSKYAVSKTTLRRAVKVGRLLDYRIEGTPDNSPLVLSEREVAAIWPKKI